MIFGDYGVNRFILYFFYPLNILFLDFYGCIHDRLVWKLKFYFKKDVYLGGKKKKS